MSVYSLGAARVLPNYIIEWCTAIYRRRYINNLINNYKKRKKKIFTTMKSHNPVNCNACPGKSDSTQSITNQNTNQQPETLLPSDSNCLLQKITSDSFSSPSNLISTVGTSDNLNLNDNAGISLYLLLFLILMIHVQCRSTSHFHCI